LSSIERWSNWNSRSIFFQFQKAYLLSVVWMPGLCKAQVESTFSTVHDALSSSLLNPRKLPLHEEDLNKPV
jgi:hypothetical protein